MEKQLRIVQGLNAMGLAIDEDYLYEKFGVKKAKHIADGDRKQAEESTDEASKTGNGVLSDRRQLSLWERFFAEGAKRK